MESMKEFEKVKYLLRIKKKEIKELRDELKGKNQIIQMLEALVLEGIEKKGRIEISKDDISKGLKKGYKIQVTEDKYILERKE